MASKAPDYKEKRKAFRDYIWEYPDIVGRLYSSGKILVNLLFGIAAGLGVFSLLILPDMSRALGNGDPDTYREGVVGSVTTLNPIYLTQNPIDRDLYELIYDKLVYVNSDGGIEPGLVSKWESSEDLKRYTFTLAPNRLWHDNTPITTDDVIYTIAKAKKLAGKDGLETVGNVLQNATVTKVNEYTFTLELDDPSAVTLEAISIYILPKHIVKDIKDENYYKYGSEVPPVGSGAYFVSEISPTQVSLKAFDGYPTKALTQNFEYHIYPDLTTLITAFENNLLDVVSHLDSTELDFIKHYKRYSVETTLLKQRRKLIFFNNRLDNINDFQIKGALSSLINKGALLEGVNVDGNPVFSPISSDSWAYNEDSDTYGYDPAKAKILLKDAGYSLAEDGYYTNKAGERVTFTMTYLETPLNEEIAQFLRNSLAEEGIEFKLRPKTYGQISNEVLARRDFELLLFEVETSIDPDQYNLWHSSRIDYPDLNIGGYQYGRVDVVLEEARKEESLTARKEKYLLFQKYLAFDAPAIFLYEPTFNLAVSEGVTGIDLEGVAFPHDRFRNVGELSVD